MPDKFISLAEMLEMLGLYPANPIERDRWEHEGWKIDKDGNLSLSTRDDLFSDFSEVAINDKQ